MKRVKGIKGFTLVEVIVVGVIVAILAAVAIPLYTGYVTKSKERVCENLAGSCASFLGATRQSDSTQLSNLLGGHDGPQTLTGAEGTTFLVPDKYTVTITADSVSACYTGDCANIKSTGAYTY